MTLLNEKHHHVKGKSYQTKVTCDCKNFIEEVTCANCGIWSLERNVYWLDNVPYCPNCCEQDVTTGDIYILEGKCN